MFYILVVASCSGSSHKVKLQWILPIVKHKLLSFMLSKESKLKNLRWHLAVTNPWNHPTDFVYIVTHFGVSALCGEMRKFCLLQEVMQCEKMNKLGIFIVLETLAQVHSFAFDAASLIEDLARCWTSASLALTKNVNEGKKEFYNLAVTHLHSFSF